jgi:hypothetical protein
MSPGLMNACSSSSAGKPFSSRASGRAQLGHSNLGVTSIYLQGIDSSEIINTVHPPSGTHDPRGRPDFTAPADAGRRVKARVTVWG